MTSTEFARRYRLLKNVANRGARSFLAQQVDLGRMVMVHYLDSETVQQRVATLRRLEALTRPARDKLLEIADVDGSPVAVTLFVSSFVDFTSWLDSVSSAPAKAVASAPPAPRSEPAPQPAGDFTRMFGKLEPPPAFSPSVATQPHTLDMPGEARLMAESRVAPNERPPVAPPMPVEAMPPMPPMPSFADNASSAAPSESGSGFTAIFGAFGGDSAKRDLPQGLPPLPEIGGHNRVMPPVAPPAEVEAAPVPALPEAPAPGEFTQLFQRLSPSAPPSPTTNGTISAPSFESPRPVETVRHGDLGQAPPAAPGVMSGFGGPPAGLRPPAFGGPASPPSFGSAPLSSGGGNIMSRVGADAGPSEFTRILSPIALPSAPAMSSAPAAAPKSEASPEPPAAAPQKKSMVPVIVALNVLVLLTIAIVAYFVLRR